MRYIATKFGHAVVKLKPDMKVVKDSITTLMQWLIFNVGIAVLPILVNYLRVVSVKGRHFNTDMLFSHGELLLISVAITAEAVGGLMVSKPGKGLRKILIGGAGILLLIIASFWFADIAAEIGPLNTTFIASKSLLVFFAALLTGASCKLLGDL